MAAVTAPSCEDIHARFHGLRHGFITSSKRVLCLAKDGLYCVDGANHDVVKEVFMYAEIGPQSLTIASKPTDVTIRAGRTSATYTIRYRAEFLSKLLYILESTWGDDGEMYRVVKRSRKSESIPCILVIRPATLRRVDPNTMKVVSTHLLQDIIEVTVVSDVESAFMLHWRDGHPHYFAVKDGQRPALLDTIRENLARYLGTTCPVTSCTSLQVSVFLEDHFHRTPETYYTVTLQKANSVTSDVFYLCDLALTQESIMVRDGEVKQTLSVNPIQNAASIIVSSLDGKTFVVEFTHGEVMKFATSSRAAVLASILETAERAGYHIASKSELCPSGLLIDPPYADHDAAAEDYFVRSLLPERHPRATLLALRAFNANMPLVGMATRDKRALEPLLAVLSADGGETAVQLTFEALGALQRLLSSKFYFEEVPRAVLPVVPRVFELCRHEQPMIALAAAGVLKSLVKQTFPYKNEKLEAANKAAVLSGDAIPLIVDEAVRRALIVNDLPTAQTLFETLESVVLSRERSTPDDVLTTAIDALEVALPELHLVCRSPAPGVVRYASLLIRAVLEDVQGLPSLVLLQHEARHTAALLTHVHNACFLAHAPARAAAADVIALLVTGNSESLDLVKRMFPRRLLSEGLSEPMEIYGNDRRPAVWPPPPSTQLPSLHLAAAPLNWAAFFDLLRDDVHEPDCIWDTRTRAELQTALSSEFHAFARTLEINDSKMFRWNHDEFEVRYTCLADEIRIGDYYLRSILETGDADVAQPSVFLEQVVYHVVFSADAEARVAGLRALCWCYGKYSSSLGAFDYTKPLIRLLEGCDDRIVRDHVLYLLQELFNLRRNITAFVDEGGLGLLVRELGAIHIGGAPESDTLTQCVAGTEVGRVCLELFILAVSLVPSVDDQGRVLCPLPRVKKELCRPSYLQHIVQVLCTQDPTLVSLTTLLLDQLIRHNDAVLPELYKTGLFYFLLAFCDSDVSGAANILSICHTDQSFDPTAHGLPAAEKSFAACMLPDSLLAVLEEEGSEALAEAYAGENDTPFLVWNSNHRHTLATALAAHLKDFILELEEDSFAMYTYAPLPAVRYPSLEAELRCAGVYIRNFVDTDRFPNTTLADPLALFTAVIQRFVASHAAGESEHTTPLLKAQRILLSDHAREDGFRVYPAFATLVEVLTVTSADDLQDDEKLEQLCVAAEVALITVRTSDENMLAFTDAGGVSALATALALGVGLRGPRLGPESDLASLITTLLEILLRVTASDRTRSCLVEEPSLYGSTVVAAGLVRLPTVVDGALEALTGMTRAAGGQDALYRHGAHFVFLSWVLKYNPRRGESEAQEEARVHAALATRALACLAGLLGDSLGTASGAGGVVVHEPTVRALAALLNAGIVNRLRNPNAADFLAFFSGDHETPAVIWNRDTRAELGAFVKAKVKAIMDGGSGGGATVFESDDDVVSFEYEALSRELRVAGVYVRLYNAQPDWPLDNVLPFLEGLVGAVVETRAEWDALSDRDQTRDEVVLVRMAALTEAMENVLGASHGIETALPAFHPFPVLFGLLELRTRPALVARVLHILAATAVHNVCATAIADAGGVLFPLARLFRGPSALRLPATEIATDLCSRSSLATGELLSNGGVLFALALFVDGSVKGDLRHGAAEFLAASAADASQGSAVAAALSRYLPRVCVDALSSRDLTEALSAYSEDCRTPVLIWTEEQREAVKSAVNAEVLSFDAASRAARVSSEVTPWAPAGVKDGVLQVLSEVCVAGVYVRLYNDQPQWPLVDPVGFASALIAAVGEKQPTAAVAATPLLTALANVVDNNVDVAGELVDSIQPTALEPVLRFCVAEDNTSGVHEACLDVLLALARSRAMVTFLEPVGVIAPFYTMISTQSDMLEHGLLFILRLCRLSSVFCDQALDANILEGLMFLLEEDTLDVVKAITAAVVKVLLENESTSEAADAFVSNHEEVWEEFSGVQLPEDVDDAYIMIIPQLPDPADQPPETDDGEFGGGGVTSFDSADEGEGEGEGEDYEGAADESEFVDHSAVKPARSSGTGSSGANNTRSSGGPAANGVDTSDDVEEDSVGDSNGDVVAAAAVGDTIVSLNGGRSSRANSTRASNGTGVRTSGAEPSGSARANGASANGSGAAANSATGAAANGRGNGNESVAATATANGNGAAAGRKESTTAAAGPAAPASKVNGNSTAAAASGASGARPARPPAPPAAPPPPAQPLVSASNGTSNGNANGNSSGSGMSGDLLSAIRNGKTLKPVETETDSSNNNGSNGGGSSGGAEGRRSSEPPAGDDLLAAIRAGPRLRRVDTDAVAAERLKRHSSNAGTLAGALETALKSRRNDITLTRDARYDTHEWSEEDE